MTGGSVTRRSLLGMTGGVVLAGLTTRGSAAQSEDDVWISDELLTDGVLTVAPDANLDIDGGSTLEYGTELTVYIRSESDDYCPFVREFEVGVRDGGEWAFGWDEIGCSGVSFYLEFRVNQETIARYEGRIGEPDPSFIVAIEETGPVVVGEDLRVLVRVANFGYQADSQEIAVELGNMGATSEEVALDAATSRETPSTTEEFVIPGEDIDSAGDFDLTVRSDDDTTITGVTVVDPGSLALLDVATNAPVDAGDDLEVTVRLSNDGETDLTESVEVALEGGETNSVTSDVPASGTTAETITLATSEATVGERTVTVSTDEDSITTSVTINEPTGGTETGDGNGGSPGDEGGGAGGIGTTEMVAAGGGGGLLALLGGYLYLRRSDDDDEPSHAEPAATDSSGPSAGGPDPSEAPETAPDSGETSSPSPSGSHASMDELLESGAGEADTTERDTGSSPGDAPVTPAGTAADAGAAGTDGDLDVEARLEEIDTLLADARENQEAMEYDEALAETERAIEETESLRENAEVTSPHRVPDIDPVLVAARDLDEEIRTERDAYRAAWERYQDLSNRFDEVAAAADPVDPDEQLDRLGSVTTKLDRLEESIEEYDFENIANRIDALRQNCTDLVADLESDHATIREARSAVDELETALDEAEASLEADDYGATIQQLDEMEGEIAQTNGLIESYETPDLDERIAGLRTRWEDLREQATEARGPTTGEPDEIPGVPRLHLDYADIQRVEAIGTGGNADVYRARVPTPADGPLDVAVKEPRMGGVLQDQTVEAVSGSTDPTLSPEAFEQPETSSTEIDDEADEHVPGESGTRAWTRDEDIDPEIIDPDFDLAGAASEPAGSPTKIQPGGASDSTDTDTKQQGEHRDQLLEEAEKWEKIDDHDHIVGIVDFGDEPLPWIAMEYMDGGHIAHRAGEVTLDQGLWIAIATTKAVHHAHRRGVAHLDLKPDNILFRTVDDAWDVPKVADWGLSKLLLNHSQSVAGLSTHYAAPEQFDREFGEADDITDIYQLGSVFYELFTGQRPFEGRPAQVMRQVLTADVTPPSEIADLPPEIDDILLKALAREKADRYETVVNLRNDLQDVRDSL